MPWKRKEDAAAYAKRYREARLGRFSEYNKEYRKNNPTYFRSWVHRQYEERKRYFYEHKAERGCAKCGFKDPRVLEFHHIDPEKKLFSIAGSGRKFEDVKAEIAKCITLCANCHKIEHCERRDACSIQQEEQPGIPATARLP